MSEGFLTVGRILSPWGVKGDCKVEIMTDFLDRFDCNQIVYIDGHSKVIERSHRYKDKIILKLTSINSIEDVETIRNKELEIPQHQAHILNPGQYYHFQVIGLPVITCKGDTIGIVTDIRSAGGSDVYVVTGEKGEYLIPAIEDVIKSIDLDNGCITIEVISGLLD